MAKLIHYDVGDLWLPQATFTVANVNTDPTNLTVTQQDAAGVETVLLNNVLVSTLNAGTTPVAKTATGIFKLSPGISLSAAGHWYVKFTGAGAAVATEQQECIVDPDQFAVNNGLSTTALVQLSDARDYLAQLNIDTSNDLLLARVINDISDRFAEEAEREFKVFGTNPQVRTFDVDEQAIWRREIRVGDLTSFTQVRILDELGNVIQTPALADVISLPRVRRTYNPIRTLRFTQNVVRLWSGLYPFVIEVTGTWGFPSVPGSVREAVLETIASVMNRDVESYREDLSQLAPGSPDAGTVVMVGAGRQRFVSLTPSAQAVAEDYRDQLVG